MTSSPTKLTYVSFGAGVQSTALLILSNQGHPSVPRADVALFADTQDEPSWVYENVERLRAWSGIEIVSVTAGKLSAKIARGKGYSAMPLWVLGKDGRAAPGRRQCTREYKIDPIEREARRRLGYAKGQRIPKGSAVAMVGISIDEADRCAPSQTRWVERMYPLIDAGLSRAGCERIILGAGLPVPRKSACVQCPYRSDRAWREMRDTNPVEWAEAVRIDEALRDMSRGWMRGEQFVHRSLRPLASVDLGDSQLEMFTEECAGVCGV